MAEDIIKGVSRDLVDQGLLIEAGWAGLRAVWLDPDTPAEQVQELRMAFFAGAQHLFTSIMTVMDDGAEATDGDLSRLDKIQAELDAFGDQLVRDMPTEGRA